MRIFINSVLILIQLAITFLAYTPFFNKWINPNDFPYFNITAIGFPILFGVIIIMIFRWLIRNYRIAIFFLVISIPLLFTVQKTFNLFNTTESQSIDKKNLKVVTFNIHYEFGKNPLVMETLLRSIDADVMMFQEIGHGTQIFFEKHGFTNYHLEDFNGLAIASKYPILYTESHRLESYPKSFAIADIKVRNDTIRFINFYLESLHLDQKEIKNPSFDKSMEHKSKNLIKKIAKTSKIHARQIDEIRESIKNSPYPLIVGGDMNAVPSSSEYYSLSKGLKDVFLEVGKGWATTFPGFRYPLRLDYIFTSTDITPVIYQVHRADVSDHYPVVAEFAL